MLWLSWEQGLLTKVNTYGPPPLVRMTRLFLEMNEADIKGRIAEEGRTPFAGQVVPHEITRDGVVLQDENVKVTAALVDHGETKPAFAYRFDCPDRSIVISGDTKPSPNLVRLAEGADILVHEVLYAPALPAMLASTAAFASKMAAHMASGHTTAEDVGRIASEARVKTLVLSHFVPSGTTVSDQQWLDAAKLHFSGTIVVGRDLMEL